MFLNNALCLNRLLEMSSLEVLMESARLEEVPVEPIALPTVGNILLKAAAPSLSAPLAAPRTTLPPTDGLLADGRVPDIMPYLRSSLDRAYTRRHRG